MKWLQSIPTRIWAQIAIFSMILCACGSALAQTGDDIGFFQRVFDYIAQFGGLNWAGKVAGGIFLLIGAMKVSFLSKVWDFFGEYKPLVPLVLSMIAGIISLGVDPNYQITWAAVTAYIVSGAGAIILNSILDFIKAIPGLGPLWVSAIEFLQLIFRSKQPLESKKIEAKRDMNAELQARNRMERRSFSA